MNFILCIFLAGVLIDAHGDAHEVGKGIWNWIQWINGGMKLDCLSLGTCYNVS